MHSLFARPFSFLASCLFAVVLMFLVLLVKEVSRRWGLSTIHGCKWIFLPMQPLLLHCPLWAYLQLDPRMRSIEGDPNDEFDATIFQGFRNLLALECSYLFRLVNKLRDQEAQYLAKPLSVTDGSAIAARVAAAKAGLLRTLQGDAVGVTGQLVPRAPTVKQMTLGSQSVKIGAA